MVKLLAAKRSLIDRHMSGVQRIAASLLLQAWPLSRALITSAHSKLTKTTAAQDLASTWWTIWSQRDDWRQGWPITTATDARNTTQPNQQAPSPFRLPADRIRAGDRSAVEGLPRA